MEALTLNAPPETQRELKKVLVDETTYLNDQRELAAEVQQQSEKRAPHTNNTLIAYRVDVFYCGGPASTANLAKARRMQEMLKQQVSEMRVRVRELAPSINASPGFSVTRSEVRYEASTEAAVAVELARILSVDGLPLPLRTVSNLTPWYLSVFAC